MTTISDDTRCTAVLTTCNNVMDANLIKGMLENNGIECFLVNENTTTLLPHFNGMLGSGVQVVVWNDDLATAAQLLNPTPQDQPVTCPNCHSTNVKLSLGKGRFKKIIAVIISILVMIPFGNIHYGYCCCKCGTEF